MSERTVSAEIEFDVYRCGEAEAYGECIVLEMQGMDGDTRHVWRLHLTVEEAVRLRAELYVALCAAGVTL